MEVGNLGPILVLIGFAIFVLGIWIGAGSID